MAASTLSEKRAASSAWKSSGSRAASRRPKSSIWKSSRSASSSRRSSAVVAGLRTGLRGSAPAAAGVSCAASRVASRWRISAKAPLTTARISATTPGLRSYTGRTAVRASWRRCSVIARWGMS